MEILQAKVEGDKAYLVVNAVRLDAATSSEFKAACQQLWEPRIASLEIDLSQVEFIDSSGIGALLNLYKRLPPANAIVRLVRVKPPVQAVIELLRLNRIFEITS